MPNHHKRTNAMGAERHQDSPRLAAAANRQKKAPAGTGLVGAKVAIRHTRPKEHQRTGT
jgi:hypothetical protein